MAYVLIIEALEEVIIGYLNAWPPETCERPLNKVSIDTSSVLQWPRWKVEFT